MSDPYYDDGRVIICSPPSVTEWSAGERMMRPALRGWRGAAAEKARDRWAAAPPRAEARRLEEVMVREAQGEPDDQ